MLRTYFQKFLESGGYCTPPGRAACAIDKARTLIRWKQAESDCRVRIVAEPEVESYASVFGKEEYEASKEYIEQWGVHWVYTEFRGPDGEWKQAESIGMCVYENPKSPFENCYVPDLMSSALEQLETAWNEAAQAI